MVRSYRLQHLIIQFPLYYLLVVAYGRLKIKIKFQTFSSKGTGHFFCGGGGGGGGGIFSFWHERKNVTHPFKLIS